MRTALAASILLGALICVAPARSGSQPADTSGVGTAPSSPGTMPPATPPARKIPGINAPDEFPKACVSCHVNIPKQNMDARISTLMKAWTVKVDSLLLAKAKAAAPAGAVLKGKHPTATASLRDIPAGCIKCHGTASKKAPPFARLMHEVHLVGGAENHFLAFYQGECTHCHKLKAATGAWSIPSAPEP